ncbi:MFS transporter [Streptomyces albiaxialis]|uniref:MFS transporter n=1 Tax=Streptomyces albiaxialis TaxID=329523 RepID=A0ABN2W6B7_9ACTN
MPDSHTESPSVGIRMRSRAGRWTVLTAELGSGMALLNVMMVSIAVPHFGADLHAGMAEVQWSVSVYMLMLATLSAIGGALGDRYGLRRTFMAGITLFLGASLFCGFSTDMVMLVIGRGLQGCGASLVIPCSLAVLRQLIDPVDQSRAIGLWYALGGVLSAIGPSVGGWLIELGGWRWIFFANVPVAVAALAVAWLRLPLTATHKAHRFDWTGTCLLVAALGSLTYAAISAPASGITAAPVLLCLSVGLCALLAFLRYERRPAEPLVPLPLMRSRIFAAACVVVACMCAAQTVVPMFVLLQLQSVAGYAPAVAGAALIPTSLLILLLSPVSAALLSRIGPRLTVGSAALLGVAGVLLLARIGSHAFYPLEVLPGVVLLGAGLALTFTPSMSIAVHAAPAHNAGIASGVVNTAQRAGGLLGVAAVPALAGLTGSRYLEPDRLGPAFETLMVLCGAVVAVGALVAYFAFPPRSAYEFSRK